MIFIHHFSRLIANSDQTWRPSNNGRVKMLCCKELTRPTSELLSAATRPSLSYRSHWAIRTFRFSVNKLHSFAWKCMSGLLVFNKRYSCPHFQNLRLCYISNLIRMMIFSWMHCFAEKSTVNEVIFCGALVRLVSRVIWKQSHATISLKETLLYC